MDVCAICGDELIVGMNVQVMALDRYGIHDEGRQCLMCLDLWDALATAFGG